MQEIEIVDQYCSAWNEPSQETRRRILQNIWIADAQYVDPRTHLRGIEELVNHIEKIRSNRPGTRIVRTSDLDLHHHVGRFNWQLSNAYNEVLLEGLDIVYFDAKTRKINLSSM